MKESSQKRAKHAVKMISPPGLLVKQVNILSECGKMIRSFRGQIYALNPLLNLQAVVNDFSSFAQGKTHLAQLLPGLVSQNVLDF